MRRKPDGSVLCIWLSILWRLAAESSRRLVISSHAIKLCNGKLISDNYKNVLIPITESKDSHKNLVTVNMKLCKLILTHPWIDV